MNIGLTILCYTLTAIALLLPAITIAVGKIKLNRALQPIEYYPPRGYSPVDVLAEYYGQRANAHNIINPLMLYWASRGFITIEEDCRRGLKLTKLKNLEPPKHIKPSDHAVKKNFQAEIKFFNAMFASGDVVYTLAANKTYKDNNDKFIKKCNENARSTRSPLSVKLRKASMIIAFATAVINTLITGLSVGGPIFAMSIFPLVGMLAFKSVDSIDDHIAIIIKYPFFIVWGGVPLTMLLSMLPFDAALVMGISTISCAVALIALASKIQLRNAEDIEIYGKIRAFKKFLLHAERDRLETLVEENPDYYYDILPYCYVLKITEKLKAKFDRINLDGPSWYLGELRDTLMF